MENSNGGDDCNNSTFTVFSSFRDLYHRGVVFVTTMKSGVNDASLYCVPRHDKKDHKRGAVFLCCLGCGILGRLFFVFSDDDDVIATEKKKKKCGKTWEEEQKMENNNTTNNNKKAL